MHPKLEHDTAVILVDHGSEFEAANRMLNSVVKQFQQLTGIKIVEPAHMELSHPTMAQAFARCIERGATRVIVHPYFLSPGRHSTNDIPEMVAAAAAAYPEVTYSVSEPLGLDERISAVILDRVVDAAMRLPGALSRDPE